MRIFPIATWSVTNRRGCFHLDISDAKVREVADAMVKTGMRGAGYLYLVIDDGWQGERDASGALHPSGRFPDMKALGSFTNAFTTDVDPHGVALVFVKALQRAEPSPERRPLART